MFRNDLKRNQISLLQIGITVQIRKRLRRITTSNQISAFNYLTVMHFTRTHQPAKGIYTIIFLALLPLRILFTLFYYLPRPLREHPQWTYRQAVSRAIFRMLWVYGSAVEFRTSKSLEPGADKERFITMNPAEESAYRDILKNAEVCPAKIGGMWYPKLYSSAEDAKKVIVLHFHGGGYVIGGCRPKEGG